MRFRRFLPLALISGLTLLVACVGDDPVLIAPASGDDAGASATPDSSSAADAGSSDGGSGDASAPPGCIAKTTGPHSPRNVVSVGGADPWTTPGNAKDVDGLFASVLLSTAGSLRSDWLEARDFGFDIPLTATIRGVEVHVTRGPGSGSGIAKDSGVKIGDVTTKQFSSEKRDEVNWPQTLSTASYGDGTDAWGLSLTPQALVSADFGVQLSAVLAGSEAITAEIDAIAVDVTYCE